MPRRGTESEFELTTIERLEALGYRYVPGDDVDRAHEAVVLEVRLRTHLSRQYDDLPVPAIEEAVKRFIRPEGATPIRRNMAFHRDLAHGIEVRVDIFQASGIERADISILDDEFLQTFKNRPYPNLRLKLLDRLLADEIRAMALRNPVSARSFRELLEATLQKYHNRLIDAASVIRAMIEIRKEMEEDERRGEELGLEADKLTFYDAVAAQFDRIYEVEFLTDLIHEVVQTIKGNLKVDWTEPHRDDVKAAVRSAVKHVLRRRKVKSEDLETLCQSIMAQAELLYADWPVAA